MLDQTNVTAKNGDVHNPCLMLLVVAVTYDKVNIARLQTRQQLIGCHMDAEVLHIPYGYGLQVENTCELLEKEIRIRNDDPSVHFIGVIVSPDVKELGVKDLDLAPTIGLITAAKQWHNFVGPMPAGFTIMNLISASNQSSAPPVNA